MNWAALMPLLWIACGAAILLFAPNLWFLWGLWLITFGVIIGKSFSSKARLPETVCGIIVASIIGVIVVRALPVHSLDWESCSRMTITRAGEDWQIEITDPSELNMFKSYARRGHYVTMIKSGYGYHLYVGDKDSSQGYYIHGNSIGDSPGGFVQSIFVPQKEGFQKYFETVLETHGHERK